MCSGRVDLSFVLKAFLNGMDGVFIGGCHFNECHYVTDGNYHALGMVLLCHKLMAHIGLNTGRLRLEGISAGEGIRFSEIMNDFARSLKQLGPIGKGEGIEASVLKRRLEAAEKLVPFIRLAARERLRVASRSEAAYRELYAREEMDRLFAELIADRLAVSQIVGLLGDGGLSTGDLSKKLGLSPSETSRHLRKSSQQGLVKYDVNRRCYSLA